MAYSSTYFSRKKYSYIKQYAQIWKIFKEYLYYLCRMTFKMYDCTLWIVSIEPTEIESGLWAGSEHN